MDVEQIRALAGVMTEAGLTRLKVTEGALAICLEKKEREAESFKEQESEMPSTQETKERKIEKTSEEPVDFNRAAEVKAPMVGVFYAAPSPEEEPFVKRGTRVKRGDVLCIIEAMKLLNEITAEIDGEIVDICVENGQVVEFSQTMFKIC